jgi:F-type H+-transporting ATPase subunit b
MFLLQDPRFWILVSFVIFIVAGVKLGKGAVFAMLDKRIDAIRKEIETADALRREAQDLLREYTAKQAEAAQEAAAILESARRHAEHIQQQAEENMKETVRRREEQLAERLRRMEESAIQDIRAYAAELAVKATAELIAAHMDEKTNTRLVNDSISTLARDAA